MEISNDTIIVSLYERLMSGKDITIIYDDGDQRITFYRYGKKYFNCEHTKNNKMNYYDEGTTKSIKDFIKCLVKYDVYDQGQETIENRNPIETSLLEIEKIIVGILPIHY
jgi:hypothetical protein